MGRYDVLRRCAQGSHRGRLRPAYRRNGLSCGRLLSGKNAEGECRFIRNHRQGSPRSAGSIGSKGGIYRFGRPIGRQTLSTSLGQGRRPGAGQPLRYVFPLQMPCGKGDSGFRGALLGESAPVRNPLPRFAEGYGPDRFPRAGGRSSRMDHHRGFGPASGQCLRGLGA